MTVVPEVPLVCSDWCLLVFLRDALVTVVPAVPLVSLVSVVFL